MRSVPGEPHSGQLGQASASTLATSSSCAKTGGEKEICLWNLRDLPVDGGGEGEGRAI